MASSHWLAVDFDDTIYSVGYEVPQAVATLLHLQAQGMKLLLLTLRQGLKLEEAVDWCAEFGLRFDAVNNCPDQSGPCSGKVFAHLYIDDRNVGCPRMLFRGKWVVDWQGIRKILGERDVAA